MSTLPESDHPAARITPEADPTAPGEARERTNGGGAAAATDLRHPLIGARVLLAGSARLEYLAQALSRTGYDVTTVRSGEAALTMLDRDPMDLVLLDTDLPGISGFEVCRRIRAFSDVPIIFTTTDASLDDRVLGFDSGADDYVMLPAEILEIDRRARALLRRMRVGSAARQVTGPKGITLDVRAHRAFVRSEQVLFTPKEFSVLQLLLERIGEVLSSDEISRQIWGYETYGSRNFVEAHISRLRAKLADAGAAGIVETVRGVGYVIRPAATEF